MRLPKYKKIILSHLSYFSTCIEVVRIFFLSPSLTNFGNTTLHTIFFLLSPILAMGLLKYSLFSQWASLSYFSSEIAKIQKIYSLPSLLLQHLYCYNPNFFLSPSLTNFGNTTLHTIFFSTLSYFGNGIAKIHTIFAMGFSFLL